LVKRAKYVPVSPVLNAPDDELLWVMQPRFRPELIERRKGQIAGRAGAVAGG
jgi:hypothetical protein